MNEKNNINSMLADGIQKILDVADKPEYKEYAGELFCNKELFQIEPAEYFQSTIHISTLTGIVEYITADLENIKPEESYILISDPSTVSFISIPAGNREITIIFIRSKCHESKFNFGSWYDLEEFIISVQTHFEQTKERDLFIQTISKVDRAAGEELEDDGITQKATFKKGASLRERGDIPNPITLNPYRTFIEVQQPESKFIFRIKNDNPATPLQFALFECDGGLWKIEAIESIRNWLQLRITTHKILA